MEAPMPLDAPVTTATLPANLFPFLLIISLFLYVTSDIQTKVPHPCPLPIGWGEGEDNTQRLLLHEESLSSCLVQLVPLSVRLLYCYYHSNNKSQKIVMPFLRPKRSRP